MEGKGIYTWLDGKRYQGNYKKGVKCGYGEMKWPNGKKFQGEWKDGKQNGRGALYDNKGECVFDGDWKNGKPVLGN